MKRITISVPDEVLNKVQRAVDAGDAANVSAYFTRLAEREPDWATAREVVAQMVTRIGGVSEDDVAWAEQTLGLSATSAA
jgi:Arc/MetJ-type ribon-helix-helix transcriptional regulator